jgi:hypothetical protein
LAWAQNAVAKISERHGPVEIRSSPKATFVRLGDATRQVQVGDEIKTGDGGTVTLTLPDGSYLVITPNSTVTIQDSWSSEVRNIAKVLFGNVWFYIQKLSGDKPNPVGVSSPSALIAVRGTKFLVSVDDNSTQVRCEEGHVGVVSASLRDDREVVLDPGWKTLVRKGENPVRPIRLDEDFANRSFKVVQKDPADAGKLLKGASLPDLSARDNDRGNRPGGGAGSLPMTTTDSNTGRAKLSFP